MTCSTTYNSTIPPFSTWVKSAFSYAVCSSFSRPNFTGKETDCETGYSYFGARYYDPTLLTSFLSIDRYADKYPSLSPYHYCSWNSMRYIDYNGDSLMLYGKDQSCIAYILNDLQKRYPNLNFTKNEMGYVSCDGIAETEEEKYIQGILQDPSILVKLKVQPDDIITFNKVIHEGGGAFLGTTYDEESSSVKCFQVINALKFRCIDPYSSNLTWHEISEAYEAGKISLNNKRSYQPCDKEFNTVLQQAHNNSNYYFCGNVESFLINGTTNYTLEDYLLNVK